MDLFTMIRYYLIIIAIFFAYMYQTNKTWYNNKFVFYAATVYVPVFIFSAYLLNI